MKAWLKENGIKVTPMYIKDGSMRGSWRLNGEGSWWDRPQLWEKFTSLGFVDYDGDKLDRYSGNGGQFSIFPRLANKEIEKQLFS